jgi:hypothetical protein
MIIHHYIENYRKNTLNLFMSDYKLNSTIKWIISLYSDMSNANL